MSFPLQIFLLVGADGLECNELIETVQHCIALRAPSNRVDGFVGLDEIGAQVTILGPDLEAAILTSSGKGSSVVTPLE